MGSLMNSSLLAGSIGVVCCLLWLILVYDDPVSHPWISSPEKEYILSSLDQQVHILHILQPLQKPYIHIWVPNGGSDSEPHVGITTQTNAFIFSSTQKSNHFPSKLCSNLCLSGPCVFAV